MELRELRHFELRELCYFVAVAEELHFARAAERVGIHQSPLSKAITLMERQLGVRLFTRDRRSTQLTPIGEVLLGDARRILIAANQAHLSIRAAAEGRTGRLRIAVGDGLAHPRLAELLRRTNAEDPEIDLQVIRCKPHEQLRMLRSGLLDIGLAETTPDLQSLFSNELSSTWGMSCLGDDVDAIPIWKDRVSVVFDRNYRHLPDGEIDWESVDSTTLILSGERSSGCTLSRTLVDLSGRARHLHFVRSAGLLLTLVAAGKGVGLLGVGLANTIHRDDLAVRPLRLRRPKVTTYLLRRKDDESPLISQFIDRAQRVTWQTAP